MAKASQKPPSTITAFEMSGITRLTGEGDEALEGMTGEHITHVPSVDIFSTRDSFTVEVEMPGVRKEDIEITLVKNTITIKALKYECFDDEKVNYVCMERSFGRFCRVVDIPFPVNTSQIRAVCKNGILTITVPRVEDKRAHSKRVPIESD